MPVNWNHFYNCLFPRLTFTNQAHTDSDTGAETGNTAAWPKSGLEPVSQFTRFQEITAFQRILPLLNVITTCYKVSHSCYSHLSLFRIKLLRSGTSNLPRIQNIHIIMITKLWDWFPVLSQAAAFPVLGEIQKWKLRPFSVLGLPKVETVDEFPVSGRFNFWACTSSLK